MTFITSAAKQELDQMNKLSIQFNLQDNSPQTVSGFQTRGRDEAKPGHETKEEDVSPQTHTVKFKTRCPEPEGECGGADEGRAADELRPGGGVEARRTDRSQECRG